MYIPCETPFLFSFFNITIVHALLKTHFCHSITKSWFFFGGVGGGGWIIVQMVMMLTVHFSISLLFRIQWFLILENEHFFYIPVTQYILKF